MKYRTDRETDERFFFCPKKTYTIIKKINISIPSNKKRKHQNTNYIILFTFPSRAASWRFCSFGIEHSVEFPSTHTLSLWGFADRFHFKLSGFFAD
ncbi:hypothetical protein NC653_016481 [Populus alba x Populus x berolinensis]|uniref:Uncharacterized protein n=1 Tax=Populus alba x Populus x berolinensis TaxID=444605 RepID=A0AAD6VZP7_9ROSI|nr:hypothetical protein NC653_016481 [Populus alba x Populus x berolinensis]